MARRTWTVLPIAAWGAPPQGQAPPWIERLDPDAKERVVFFSVTGSQTGITGA